LIEGGRSERSAIMQSMRITKREMDDIIGTLTIAERIKQTEVVSEKGRFKIAYEII